MSEVNPNLDNQELLSIDLNTGSILKFLIPSLFGIFMFLFPIPYQGATSTPVGVVSEWLASGLGNFLPIFITYVVVISGVLSLVNLLFKPKFISDIPIFKSLFDDTPLFVTFRILGAIFIVIIYNQVGPEMIWSGDTGGTMLSLVSTLVAWFFAASYLIPFLMNFGAMDFTGTLIRGVIKPLFTLPGRSAIDLLTSWIGNCNVGVVLTREQHKAGYYTGREAALIATCFSAVSLPFVLVVAAMLKIDHVFIPLYLSITATGIIVVTIMARIPPLSTITDKYHPDTSKRINEVEPEGITKFEWGLRKAVDTASEAPSLSGLIKAGTDTFLGIIFKLSPLVIAWGTIALIIATFTPVFNWLSYPFAYYLKILGVPEAFAAAPATIVGFADMFIPAILAQDIASEFTRFVIGGLSIVQIIYMTEVGTLIVTSDIPLDVKDLFIIFVEKTILAIPLLVIAAHLVL